MGGRNIYIAVARPTRLVLQLTINCRGVAISANRLCAPKANSLKDEVLTPTSHENNSSRVSIPTALAPADGIEPPSTESESVILTIILSRHNYWFRVNVATNSSKLRHWRGRRDSNTRGSFLHRSQSPAPSTTR